MSNLGATFLLNPRWSKDAPHMTGGSGGIRTRLSRFCLNPFPTICLDWGTLQLNKLTHIRSCKFPNNSWDSCSVCPLRRSLRVTRGKAPNDSHYGTSAPSPARKYGGLRFCPTTLALRPRTALTVVNITPCVARRGFAVST